MATRNWKTDASHLRFRVQPFDLQSFRRRLTFLPRGIPPMQPRIVPVKREIIELLSTDYLYRDWDAKFLNFGQVTSYQNMVMSSEEVEKFFDEMIQYEHTSYEHQFYRLLSDHKSIMDKYYGRFGAFLVKLAEYNRSQDIGEKNYEYYLTVLRMLASVASRCQDLLTIGFQLLSFEPDIYAQYRNAVYRACKVSRALRDDLYTITGALFDRGLVQEKDVLDYPATKVQKTYEVLKSKPLASSGVRYAGVSPRNDPAIRDHASRRANSISKSRFGERPLDSTGLRAGDSVVYTWRRESFSDPDPLSTW